MNNVHIFNHWGYEENDRSLADTFMAADIVTVHDVDSAAMLANTCVFGMYPYSTITDVGTYEYNPDTAEYELKNADPTFGLAEAERRRKGDIHYGTENLNCR